MTVLDYRHDPELLSLLDCWVWDGRCPLPLVDWLLERGLQSAAEAARWAATEPRRPRPHQLVVRGVHRDRDPQYPQPTLDAESNPRWRWWVSLYRRSVIFCDALPPSRYAQTFVFERFASFREAALAMLAGWQST